MIITYTAEELQHIENLKKEYGALIQKAETSKERATLSLQLSEELTRYTESCQRERFRDLEGKPEEILANAQGQLEILLELEYRGLTDHSTPQDLNKLGISTMKQGRAYIKASFMEDLIRNELRFHIEALHDDKPHLEALFSSIVEAVENSEFTDTSELTTPASKEVLRYRRSPLADINTFGLMNDYASTSLITDNGIVQQTPDGKYQLLWSVNQAKKQEEVPVPVYIALTFDGTEKLSRELTHYDLDVYNSISTMFHYWKRENPYSPLYISPQEIWRIMNGKQSGDGSAKPSANQVEKICSSIHTMRHTDFYMDIREEIKAHHITFEDERIVGGYIQDYLLNCTPTVFYTEKGRTVEGYRINFEPILYTYNAAKDRVLFLPFYLLDTSNALSDSENVTEFKQYLLQQILLMKNGTRDSRKMLLSTIYKKTGIQPPEERIEGREYSSETTRQQAIRQKRKEDRTKIEKLLGAWKDKGWIKDYRALTANNKPAEKNQIVASYEVILEKKKKEKIRTEKVLQIDGKSTTKEDIRTEKVLQIDGKSTTKEKQKKPSKH